MKASFYAGATGLSACQQAMNTIGNNLANVNTVGYQKETVAFEDLMRSGMYVNAQSAPLTGSGVRTVSTGVQIGQGSPQLTNGTLDFAIAGDGFFAVRKNGEIGYTRNGAFAISVEDGRDYLCTIDGAQVLDRWGSPIQVRQREDDGQIDSGDLLERLGVYRFENPNALVPGANSGYSPSALSGGARLADEDDYDLLHGFLEGSGANMVDGMVDMISAQRAFQLCARVVQTSDELEQIVSGLRR